VASGYGVKRMTRPNMMKCVGRFENALSRRIEDAVGYFIRNEEWHEDTVGRDYRDRLLMTCGPSGYTVPHADETWSGRFEDALETDVGDYGDEDIVLAYVEVTGD